MFCARITGRDVILLEGYRRVKQAFGFRMD